MLSRVTYIHFKMNLNHELIHSINHSFLTWTSILSPAICIDFGVNSILKWTSSINYLFAIWFSILWRTVCVHFQVNSMVDALFLELIRFSCNVQYCPWLHTFTTKWRQFMNGLLLKLIHFTCNLSCCHELHIDSLRNELDSWMDSS